MKRIFSLMLVLCLLLAGCGGAPAETEPSTTAAPTTVPTTAAPTTEPTTEPTTVPTEPPVVYTNPLTGETLDAPMENRIFGLTINNVRDAIPHYGVVDADLYFEMFVNDYATRGFALYTDVASVESIGSLRSMRMNFTDICQAYDAVAVYSGGSDKVLSDVRKSDIEHIHVGTVTQDFTYRDSDRRNNGWAYEHCLFVRGEGLYNWCLENDVRVTQDAEKDYGLRFKENAAPADGEDATTISIDMTYKHVVKNTTLTYNAETGKYLYHQYKKDMADGITGEAEEFKNVIVMLCEVKNIDIYHVATLLGSGEGYFACDGKLIPIQWHREADEMPFTYTLTDGTPLELGIGNSYICFAPKASPVSWE